MTYWIFQSDPKIYDIHGALEEYDSISWVTRQHADEIHVGDAVLVWCAGDKAGIYAIGQVISEPEVRPSPDDPHWLNPEDRKTPELRVTLAITKRFHPVLRKDLKDHPAMRDSQIIKARVGTNFRVTPEQWSAIIDLLRE